MERRPGSNEHQLVRGAAGEPAHRASKRATLFAPGAGAPTTEFARRSTALGAIGCAGDSGAAGGGSHPGRVLLQGDARGKLAHRVRSRPVGSTFPGSVYPRGVAHPRYANPSRCNPGKDEHQLVRGAAGGLAHRATRHTTLFAPGAGAPTRRRQRKDGSSSSIAARGLDVPRQRVPPGRSAPALRQPEPVQPWEGRAPARPPLTPQPTPTTAESPPLPAPPPQTPVTAAEAQARPTGTPACLPSRSAPWRAPSPNGQRRGGSEWAAQGTE